MQLNLLRISPTKDKFEFHTSFFSPGIHFFLRNLTLMVTAEKSINLLDEKWKLCIQENDDDYNDDDDDDDDEKMNLWRIIIIIILVTKGHDDNICYIL